MKTTLTIIFCLFSVTAYGQAPSDYPIDNELQDCLDVKENQTTEGMTSCVISASDKWEALLNSKLEELSHLLSDYQKELLMFAQEEWVEFRENELKFSNYIFSGRPGTMWDSVAARTRMNLNRQRTIEIKAHILNLRY